jgi:hypothetical protein
MRTIITPDCRDWAKWRRKCCTVSRPETPCSPLCQIKLGSRGSRFSSDACGYLQAAVPAELTHGSLRFRRPPLQVQSRGKPDAKSRVLTASRAGVNFPVGNCSLRTLVPVVPRMDRGKREGRENRLRSRHCDRRARSSQSVSRRTATFLPAQKGKAEEEAMTREPGNLPGNYNSA